MNKEQFINSALGKCESCGHPDSWHHEDKDVSALFGLMTISFDAGCGYIECNCEGYEGESLIIDS